MLACGSWGYMLESSVAIENDGNDEHRRRKTPGNKKYFHMCNRCIEMNYWDPQARQLRVAPDAVPILLDFFVSFVIIYGNKFV